MVKSLSIGKALKEGWSGFKKNWLFFILVMLAIAFVKGMYYGGLGSLLEPLKGGALFGFLISVLEMIAVLFLYLGLYRVSLQVIRGKKAMWKDFVSAPSDLWKYFLGGVLYFLALFGGLILLIVPGIIWGLKFMMYPFLIAEQRVGALDALKLSAKATNGAKWDLFGFNLVMMLLFVGGMLLLTLGLFIVVPLWTLSTASLYNTLTQE